MRGRDLAFVALMALAAGCSVVRHGILDFAAPPLFEIPIGKYSVIMCFRDSTVVRLYGGTWYTIHAPFYILLAALLVPLLVWFVLRHKRNETTR